MDRDVVAAVPDADPGIDAGGSVGAPANDTATPRSRRALLAGALGAVVGGVAGALGRPSAARAAAGDPLILGQQNYAGISATRLTTLSSGGAFWMTQNGFGSGVRGDSVNGHGGVFTTGHPDRHGLFAQQLGSHNAGSAVRADGGNNHGVNATTAHGGSYAVRAMHGVATAHNAAAVYAHGQGGYGVYAESSNKPALYGISTTIGVQAVGPDFGVYSQAGNQFGTAVQGIAGGSSGHGVVGAISNDSAAASGVYGESAGDNSYAGYFVGHVEVTGTLSGAIAAARIDHPLDPANRILQHSLVESPEMKTVYDGVVETDADGAATIELPPYFDALNGDVRYQLSALGEAMPGLHVAQEVRDNRFAIAGAAPNSRVSWLVTGIRRDAYAKAHRLGAEVDKSNAQRGLYLHPKEHGKPASKGVDYEASQRIRELPAGARRP
jgi:hypothetical protein